MQKQEITNLIQSIGFQDGSKELFVRENKEHNYAISLDFQKNYEQRIAELKSQIAEVETKKAAILNKFLK